MLQQSPCAPPFARDLMYMTSTPLPRKNVLHMDMLHLCQLHKTSAAACADTSQLHLERLKLQLQLPLLYSRLSPHESLARSVIALSPSSHTAQAQKRAFFFASSSVMFMSLMCAATMKSFSVKPPAVTRHPRVSISTASIQSPHSSTCPFRTCDRQGTVLLM